MTRKQIQIGPEFFVKAKNDYSDWHWAIIREFMQNSIDCGSKNIGITIEAEGTDTRLIVTNDGDPMTSEVMEGKLLSLGSSGKNFRGSVGGFGKAKEILYFCHKSYSIESGDVEVKGSGAGYTITSRVERMDGTRSIVLIEGNHTSELMDACKKFAAFAQWNGTFRVNGSNLGCTLHKGSYRRELDSGKLYTNRSHRHRLVCRIGGIPMFVNWISFDRCVVLELDGSSLSALTSNRDSLRGAKSEELVAFLQSLAADKHSALKVSNPTYTQFEGERFTISVEAPTPPPTSPIFNEGGESDEEEPTASVQIAAGGDPSNRQGIEIMAAAAKAERQSRSRNSMNCEFIVKNETGMVVPSYYLPIEGKFSSYSRKLARIWANLMYQMHVTFEHKANFTIGFIFSNDTEAQHERGPYGQVYYLNPAKIVEQRSSFSHSFKKRFKLTERDRLVMIALHELIHGMGHSWHDETYANLLTDMAAQVMANRKSFNWCFQV